MCAVILIAFTVSVLSIIVNVISSTQQMKVPIVTQSRLPKMFKDLHNAYKTV